MASPERSERRRRPGWTDEQVDLIISDLLRVGLVIASAFVIAGAVVFLARHGAEPVAYGVFRGEPRRLRAIGSIFAEAGRLNGRGLIMAGLLLLIATPIARVAFSVVAFIRQRDRIYAAATFLVLSILLFSVFWLGLH